jgi:predicted DNA-binding ArsR family transcriptional regulator
MNHTDHDANSETDAKQLFKRDMHLNQIKNKLEENRKKMLGNRLLLKQTSKTNPHLGGLVKVYDEYYHSFKTNIKLQISALERIVKHLNKMMEEHAEYADYDTDIIHINNKNKNMTRQLKKDKTMIVKEIKTLKKLLLQ